MIAELKKDDRFEMCLSYKTIYNYIDMGLILIKRAKLVDGNYWELVKVVEKSTKQYNTARTIIDRPEVTDNRAKIGHFEINLVEGINRKKL